MTSMPLKGLSPGSVRRLRRSPAGRLAGTGAPLWYPLQGSGAEGQYGLEVRNPQLSLVLPGAPASQFHSATVDIGSRKSRRAGSLIRQALYLDQEDAYAAGEAVPQALFGVGFLARALGRPPRWRGSNQRSRPDVPPAGQVPAHARAMPRCSSAPGR